MESPQVPSITFVQQLSNSLQALQDPVRAIVTLLNAMDLADGNPMSLMVDDEGRSFYTLDQKHKNIFFKCGCIKRYKFFHLRSVSPVHTSCEFECRCKFLRHKVAMNKRLQAWNL